MVEPRFETRTIPSASYHALHDGASLILLILLRKFQTLYSRFPPLARLIWLGLLLTSGCVRLEPISTATAPVVQASALPANTPEIATATPDYGWQDANDVMAGICFEAAQSMVGKVIKITDANALDNFYSQIDRGQLCEDPVNRVIYPFKDSAIIVGLWSSGTGCVAHHDVQNVQRDEAQKQETIQLALVVEGDCPYELVQPFWIALPQSADFNVQIMVQNPS